MVDVTESDAQCASAAGDSTAVAENYTYTEEDQDYSVSSAAVNRIDNSEARDSVEYAVPDTNGQQMYENDPNSYSAADANHHPGYTDQAWQATGYMGMGQDGMHYNNDVSHETHMGYPPQNYDITGGMIPGYSGMVADGSMQPADSGHMHQKMMEMNQHDMMQGHSMQQVKMDPSNMQSDGPRRMLSKGRKNKDEANELVRRAKLLPKVMGVRYDANHQYWVATWYQNRKRMDRYFSVGRFGFEEARMLAIDCRKTAGKSLQGKSYDRPQYSSKDVNSKSRVNYGASDTLGGLSYDGDNGFDKNTEYYGGSETSKKTKDFNRLNVSKVALNYILSDLCNNCLPSILENNHMPGELYIHCYNKISDHLQMIITASQSEEIEKYLHLFQLCIQNRVLPSALQVQEQRAMITTLCQM